MDKTQKTAFIDYCFDFYGDGGIYDLKFTKEEIEKGLDARINDTKGILREYEKPLSTIPFDGDSIDREMVRDIVLIQKGETPWENNLSPIPYEERNGSNEKSI